MSEINILQTNIMIYMKELACIHNTPIPLKEVVNGMKPKGVNYGTTINALNSLLHKGFIRRACTGQAHKTYYVLIRNI